MRFLVMRCDLLNTYEWIVTGVDFLELVRD